MEQYTKETYIAKFGDKAWADKVEGVNDGAEVDYVYATDSGNIFMIINKEDE